MPLFHVILSDPHHIPGDLGQRVCAAHLHGIGQLGGDLVDVALHAFLAAAVDCGDKGAADEHSVSAQSQRLEQIHFFS